MDAESLTHARGFGVKFPDLQREDLTFIGDSLKDAEKAIDFGIRFIGICGTFKHEDFLTVRNDLLTVESIKEILEL